MKLEQLGEENATQICPKYHYYKYNPYHKPIYVDPMRLPGTCKAIVNAIVNIIKKFKK